MQPETQLELQQEIQQATQQEIPNQVADQEAIPGPRAGQVDPMQQLMNNYLGPAIPAEGDNTSFAPTRAIHLPPAPKMVMGYLTNIGPEKVTQTNSYYRKLTIKLNCGFSVRTLTVNAFSNIALPTDLTSGNKVKLGVLQTGAQGQYHNLQSLEKVEFEDCHRCEHPIQGLQYNQVCLNYVIIFINQNS